MSSSSLEDAIVLNYNETLLHRSDIDLISGPYWLNDNVISFYFEFLEKEMFANRKELLFVSPEVTQCLKMISVCEMGVFLEPLDISNKLFIFFALNDNDSPDSAGGSHWSLLVYSRPEQRFFHFDSMSTNNKEHAQMLAARLLPYFVGRTDGDCNFTEMETLTQSNSYDCGIHLLCNVDMIVQHIIKYSQVAGCGVVHINAVMSKRSELLDIIETLSNNV